MFADFFYTITRGDDDFEVIVEYHAIRCFGDYDIEITEVTLDGQPFETTADEDAAMLAHCYENVDDDWQDYRDGLADQRYDYARENF